MREAVRVLGEQRDVNACEEDKQKRMSLGEQGHGFTKALNSAGEGDDVLPRQYGVGFVICHHPSACGMLGHVT